MNFVIEPTEDGSSTLRNGPDGDTYHSVRGAVGEARHVFIEAGFQAVTRSHVRVFEMGFGTGLNAFLTLLEAEKHEARRQWGASALHRGWRRADTLRVEFRRNFGPSCCATSRTVEYVAIEKHPVPEEVTATLGYSDDPRFAAMHSAPWGVWSEPAEGFRLLKLHGDASEAGFWEGLDEILGGKENERIAAQLSRPLKAGSGREILGDHRTILHSTVAQNSSSPSPPHGGTMEVATQPRIADRKMFNLVYWDAFSPDTQPELWTPEIFSRMASRMSPGAILVTYSAKGDVRRALSAAGMTVEKLPGALGKRHMVRSERRQRDNEDRQLAMKLPAQREWQYSGNDTWCELRPKPAEGCADMCAEVSPPLPEASG